MRNLRHLFAYLAVSLLLSSATFAQTTPAVITDFEDLDKTMSAFNVAFDHPNEKLLRSISTEAFEHSPEFERLRGALGRLRVSDALSSQVAEQMFDLEPGGGTLAVTFRLRGQQWVVSDAKLSGVPKAGVSGVPLLAREYFFSDFRRWFETGNAARFAGIAPFGQLPPRLMKGKKLVPRSQTTVTVTDLALHDGQKIVDLIYLHIRKSEKVENRSRGWLIDGSGSMLDYARKSDENRALLDFLSGNTKAFDFSRKSSFLFSNVDASDEPSLPTTHVDYRVEKISTSGFKWDDHTVEFSLLVDCSGATFAPPQLRVWLQDGRLYLDTRSDAGFISGPQDHRYLDVRVQGGVLSVGVKQDVDRRPMKSFQNATVERQWVRSIDRGVRFVVELTTERMPP